jgi:4-methylaminobutanoate oxidase (formaldehyde-forming)
LWDTIWESGRDRGLVAGGYKAVDSLRLEKGYRVWGSDIGPESDPYQSGLGAFVRLDKGEFIGRDALVKRRETPADTRLVCVVLDDPRSVALGSEPVRIEGQVVGRVTSGGYGYTVERSIAYAYVPANTETGTTVETEIFGTWVPGTITQEPLYDPKGLRVRS